MVGGKTSAASKNKWMAKAYDRVNLTMPKGKKELVQAHAQACGESLNGFINRAIDHEMERDMQEGEAHDGQRSAKPDRLAPGAGHGQ